MSGRYSIGQDETDNEVIVLDHQSHKIILRGGKIGLPEIRELVRLANFGAQAAQPALPTPPDGPQ